MFQQGTRKLPKLCEEIMETKSLWMMSKRPVLSYDEYKDRVKKIDPLATDKLIQISANFLQDMGEVSIGGVPLSFVPEATILGV